MPFIVPGIGYAGLGQQTAAAQQVFRQAMGGRSTRSTGARKRRRSAGSATRRTRRATARKRGGGNKFTKGSAAAKRHMAKLRKMRKR